MKPIQDDDKLILSHLADDNERYMGAVVPPVFSPLCMYFPAATNTSRLKRRTPSAMFTAAYPIRPSKF